MQTSGVAGRAPRPATLKDLFRALFRIDGAEVDLSGIRIHRAGADGPCAVWGADAMTVGSDIYLRAGRYAPHTRAGLWLLAHEVAHVVQQRRGPVQTVPLTGGWAVGPCRGAEEREADAAADAVLAGRPFLFGPPSPHARAVRSEVRILQRYAAWEHLLLGNLDPVAVGQVVPASGGCHPNAGVPLLEAQCALLEELGRNPVDVDMDRLRENYPGIQTVRLSASGLVVTLGEINVLPDYLSHPDDIDAASAAFIGPVVQAIRSQSYRQLHRVMGRSRPPRLKWSTLRYPNARTFSDVRETIEIDALGRKCQRPAAERYLSLLARNATHFAPFSWYRWQSFHLLARQMIARADTRSPAERQRLRSLAQVYAGYADHFLHDSFAAGHLANKTLIMQWYVEWLLASGAAVADRALLREMTYQRQPLLHGPDLYNPKPGGDGERLYPDGNCDPCAITGPQSTLEGQTLEARIQSSGVCGSSAEQREQRYLCYLALLRSSVAQLSAGVVHNYLNERSLVVASSPDGFRYRMWGDRAMFAGEGGATGAGGAGGAVEAATAAHASRRAIADLLATGETDVSSRQIFESLPSHVEMHGAMLPLRQWQDAELRDLCFGRLFGRPSTRVKKLLLGLLARNFGLPCEDYTDLRDRLGTGTPG
jgi:hypothetical protein